VGVLLLSGGLIDNEIPPLSLPLRSFSERTTAVDHGRREMFYVKPFRFEMQAKWPCATE
jgi:hypothetical protein